MRPPLFFSLAAIITLLLPACRAPRHTAPPSSQHLPDKSPIQSHPPFLSLLRAPSSPPGYATLRTRSEKYAEYEENPFLAVKDAPRSTFSVDVDTASYANVRRMIQHKQEVPRDSVRIEEMVNYFPYHYPKPTHETIPFAIAEEVSSCPWEPDHKLVRIAVQGQDVKSENRPHANIVFLIDVSGSMSAENKLPLLKKSLSMLIDQLNEDDRIALVVYAGSSGLVLPSTPVSQSDKIHEAIQDLSSGGSTAGGAGINLAYKTARKNFLEGGINRVILATDGDFNVGVTADRELTDVIEEKARSGIELTVLGFGMGNYNDSMLEKLSGKGNGNYAYIDTEKEARKVLVRETSGSLVTIAKDVKLQVEFNPAKVQAYRLLGYENRKLKDRDFNDDKKDAGEVGAGHQVTAFYEVVPVGVEFEQSSLTPLRY
ncbi:MAG: VWA domain-containing protein, partial [Verrucomicrobiota bacterium]